MKPRYSHLAACVLLVFALAGAGASKAGGAWPRGKGHGFISFSYSTFGDLLAYAYSLYYPAPGTEPTELTEETSFYLEFGATDRLTFGIDRSARKAENSVDAVWFFRRNFTRPEWRSSYGVELGLGTYRDWRQIDDNLVRLGLSWGRGFETRWFDGWADVDAKVIGLEKTGSVLWKVDSTFGIKPNDSSLVYLQMQTGAVDGEPTYTRAVPTYVKKVWRNISLESALLIGVQNEDNYGAKFGAWVEF